MENTKEITEDHVSFETAKLLKEKGFEGECSRIYSLIDEVDWQGDAKVEFCVGKSYPRSVYLQAQEFIPCPTLQMASKFVREQYGLYFLIERIFDYYVYSDGKLIPSPKWWRFYICEESSGRIVYNDPNKFLKYEDANDAALQYCLKELI